MFGNSATKPSAGLPPMVLLSRSGPEFPPEESGRWFDSSQPPPRPSAARHASGAPLPSVVPPSAAVPPSSAFGPPPVTDAALRESTDKFPVVKPLSVEGRAVIVYEQAPRRPWRLWVFTAVMVALTTGVVLGQAAAWQPISRASSIPTPNAVIPSPSGIVSSVVPGAGPAASLPIAPGELALPLGADKTRILEITGPAAALRIRSADLGETMLRVTPGPGSAAPQLTVLPEGPRVTVPPTGAEILLSPKVFWTIRITGPVSALDIRTAAKIPIRLTLPAGAAKATVDGKPKPAKVGATLTTGPWSTATNRYDITATTRIGTVAIGRVGA